MNQSQSASNAPAVIIPPSHPLYTVIMETGKKRPRSFIDLASPPPEAKKSRKH